MSAKRVIVSIINTGTDNLINALVAPPEDYLTSF